MNTYLNTAMWKHLLVAILLCSFVSFSGCTEEGNSLTGSIRITFVNETQGNEPELFVVPSLFNSVNDTMELRSLDRLDLSDGRDAEYTIDDLLPGSYLLKYRIEIPSTNFQGPTENRAFQIFAGEVNVLSIEI